MCLCFNGDILNAHRRRADVTILMLFHGIGPLVGRRVKTFDLRRQQGSPSAGLQYSTTKLNGKKLSH